MGSPRCAPRPGAPRIVGGAYHIACGQSVGRQGAQAGEFGLRAFQHFARGGVECGLVSSARLPGVGKWCTALGLHGMQCSPRAAGVKTFGKAGGEGYAADVGNWQ